MLLSLNSPIVHKNLSILLTKFLLGFRFNFCSETIQIGILLPFRAFRA